LIPLNHSVSAKELCRGLDFPIPLKDYEIIGVSEIGSISEGILSFATAQVVISEIDTGIVFTSEAPNDLSAANFLIIENPRLAFALAINWLHSNIGFQVSNNGNVHETASIHPTAWVEPGAKIGARSIIGPRAIVRACVTIGEDCKIHSGVILGDPGFGFVRDKVDFPVEFLHLGGVYLGDRVVIGTGSIVARGTLSDTCIGNDVKLDNLVHVAHNCKIGSGTLIAAAAELSGGVTLGENVWVGPNSSIRDGISVGDRAFIGIAANVIRQVAADSVVAGNPAKLISS
jgi:UDP-3-O-[3-hydroxymyristoyl] glucosamine N-acyltransferase